MKTTFKTLAIGVALIAAASGCQTLTGRTLGELVDNKTAQAAVKARLVGDRVQNLTWVHVDANDGVVYLTGNAETAAQKARATEIALQTHGVRRVENDIVVNSAKAETATAPSASPATTTSAGAGSGSISGEVVTVDQPTGDVTLRMAGGSDLQLRLPPSSVTNVKPGDRLSVSVNTAAR